MPLSNSEDSDMTAAIESAQEFRKLYHTRIEDKGLTAALFAEALLRYESLQKQALKPYHYAYLLFAADSEQEEHKRLLSRVREVLSEVTETTLFFDLEDDPHEFINRFNDPDYRPRVLEYVEKMLTWRMEHDEPALTDLHLGDS